MRRTQLCVVCVAVCLMSSTAFAQRGGGRGGMNFPVGYRQIASNENVQGELKLSDDQKSKLTALNEEARGNRGGGNRLGRDASDAERAAARAEQLKRTQEENKKVEAILNADQNKRIKELALWVRGPAGLGDEETAKELNLTQAQKDQLTTINEAVGSRMRDVFQNNQGDFQKIGEESAKIRTSAEPEYLGVLTAEQKTKYEAMRGAKPSYDVNTIGAFGGGGRGNRRRGNN